MDFIGKVTHGVGEIEIPETGCLWQNVTIDLPNWDEIATGRALRGIVPQEPAEPGQQEDDAPVQSPDEDPVADPDEPKKCRKRRQSK